MDIGCGWGGLATAISKCAEGLHVTGITLSENQYAYFRQSILVKNLQDQLSVNLCNYRKLGSQKFERIISVGMLEHVGRHNLTRYMQAIDKHLAEQYDDAFIRMWRFYLICSENYFRYAHGMVFQIQLARRIEDVPQTRDYINRDEEKYLKLL